MSILLGGLVPMEAAAGASAAPPPALVLPFVVLLLAIALAPHLHRHWWEAHYAKVAVALGAVVGTYYLAILGQPAPMLRAAREYTGFIALIGSLYVVAGGIHVRLRGQAKPWTNCLFLLAGAVLSNLVGTTGASMLLIRPWLRMNQYRATGLHVVFFIFIVSNIGGCLTPVGDPPLFLGYLLGVPFWWVFTRCWGVWAFTILALLAVFYVMDRANFLRAFPALRDRETTHETWQCDGLVNVVFLAIILGAVFIREPAGLSEALMAGAAAGSWFTTAKKVHAANAFNLAPIREVAWLFLGIFATMVPALDYLERHAAQIGLNSSHKLFWSTGALSAVLDNAPTYLTFFAAAVGRHGLTLGSLAHVQGFAEAHAPELMAVSLGAVFFGAVTYMGNGPNFMVKSICQHARVNTPSFVQYVVQYAVPILFPLFGLVSWLFIV